MRSKLEQSAQAEPKPASPATGIAFLLTGLGLFYGLITFVDPLL